MSIKSYNSCSAPKRNVTASQPTNSALEQQNAPMYSAVQEATSMALACGAAVLGWAVVFGSGVATVPSVGASSLVTVLAFTAASASTIQCISGVGRTGAAAFGEEQTLAWLDSEVWYQKTMIALDIVSLVGAGSAATSTIKTLAALKTAGNASTLQALKRMPRHERKRFTETLIRLMHPGISNSTIKAFIQAGTYPARYSAPQISQMLKLQLADAVGATLSFTGSAASGVIRHPNRTKDLVFGITYPVKTL